MLQYDSITETDATLSTLRKYLSHATLLAVTAALVAGCSTFRFPGVHRINVQQGNVVSQAMIDKLKPGMTKSQVRFVLGNPVVNNTLDREQWDYIDTIQVAGGETRKLSLILHFEDERLSYFEGDYVPTEFHQNNEG